MSPAHSPALELAIAAYRTPSLYSRLRERQLPEDLILLLRVVAGEAQATELACALSGESVAVVTEAAAMFIQQLLFYPGADSYRVLGVPATAVDSRIREHYRWLVRWLHPDRNDDEWDAVYADRVTLAWNDLRTPERRQAFDAKRADGESYSDRTPPIRAASARAVPLGLATEFSPPARKVRRLPTKVLSGIAAGTVLVVAWLYYPTIEDGGIRYSGNEASPAVTAMTDPPEEVERASAPVDAPALIEAMTTAMQTRVAATDRDQVAMASSPVIKPNPKPKPQPVPKPVLTPAAKLVATHASIPVMPSPTRAVAVVTVSSPRRTDIPVAPIAVQTPAVGAGGGILAAMPPPTPHPAAPELINEKIASDLILQFRSAYSSGNINQVQSLLARDSTSWHSERESILMTYRKLFESSISRHIEIHDANWLTDADTAILMGNFEAWIRRRGETGERRISGDIRFDLRSEDGELRIVRLRHDVKGG